MSDRADVDRRRDEWISAVNARDRDAYAALFAEDAVWLPPGLPAVHGREAIREWLGPFFATYEYDFSIADPQVRLGGDWAAERGRFTSRLRSTETGEETTHSGTYLVLWRREADGRWYIERYVDVTDLASGTSPPDQDAAGGG